MDEASRIHIFGAAGSGTTTLGRAVSRALGITHLDADTYYWQPTDPPYRIKNEPAVRISKLLAITDKLPGWVLTGSICGWGDPLLARFTLAAYLEIDHHVRMARLRLREIERFGERIAPDGDLHRQHRKFMDWARRYDSGGVDVRSRTLHLAWMAELGCPVIRLDSSRPVEELAAELIAAIR